MTLLWFCDIIGSRGGPEAHFLLVFFWTSLGRGSGEALSRIFLDLGAIWGFIGEPFGLHFIFFSGSHNLCDFRLIFWGGAGGVRGGLLSLRIMQNAHVVPHAATPAGCGGFYTLRVTRRPGKLNGKSRQRATNH